jgi:hypothetical protein
VAGAVDGFSLYNKTAKVCVAGMGSTQQTILAMDGEVELHGLYSLRV